MDKRSAKYFGVWCGIDVDDVTPLPADPEPDLVVNPLQEVLDEIFSVDPESGLPKGDIQYFLSSSGNPQVKQWLENNLLRPRMSSGKSLEGVTDDVIAEFSRMPNESLSDYQSRLKSLYDDAVNEMERVRSSSFEPKNE